MAQSEQARQQADIAMVGFDVAEAPVACELARTGKSVLMLGAGPRLPCWEAVERFRDQVDKIDFMVPYPSTSWAPHPGYDPPNNYLVLKDEHQSNSQYIQAVGGTTWHWAISAWRFLPNDFKLHSVYDIVRDWPTQYQDLEYYYGLAEEALSVWGPNDKDLGSPRSQPYPMTPFPPSFGERTIRDALNTHDASLYVVTEPAVRNSRPYDGRPTYCGNNSCMSICPINVMYNGIVHVEKAEQAGAQLIENIVAFKLEVGPNEHTVAARYKDSKGAEHRMEGKWLVLAVSGIGASKLMLVSTSQDFPKGVSSSSDMVGRSLMNHPGTGVSFYADHKLRPGCGPQKMTSLIDLRDGPLHTTQAGKKLHLSNISYIEQETQHISKEGKFIKPVDLDAHVRGQVAYYMQFDSFHGVLLPPENRIVPSATEVSAVSIPRPKTTYHIDDYVRRSVVHVWEVYAMTTQVVGGTNAKFHDDFVPSNHITGVAIMGANPKGSVVSKDCRTFDHPNLLVSNSSAMLTVGTVNVTLTIVTLAPRTTGQLKKGARDESDRFLLVAVADWSVGEYVDEGYAG